MQKNHLNFQKMSVRNLSKISSSHEIFINVLGAWQLIDLVAPWVYNQMSIYFLDISETLKKQYFHVKQ